MGLRGKSATGGDIGQGSDGGCPAGHMACWCAVFASSGASLLNAHPHASSTIHTPLTVARRATSPPPVHCASPNSPCHVNVCRLRRCTPSRTAFALLWPAGMMPVAGVAPHGGSAAPTWVSMARSRHPVLTLRCAVPSARDGGGLLVCRAPYSHSDGRTDFEGEICIQIILAKSTSGFSPSACAV